MQNVVRTAVLELQYRTMKLIVMGVAWVISMNFANCSLIINCVVDEDTALTRIATCEDRLVRDVDDAQVRSERLREYSQLATHELDTNGEFASAIPRIKALLALNPKTNQ